MEKVAETVVPQAAAGDAAPAEKTFLGIEASTWSKVIPLGAMFFCILFNYTILRDTKVSEPCSNPRAPGNETPVSLARCLDHFAICAQFLIQFRFLLSADVAHRFFN